MINDGNLQYRLYDLDKETVISKGKFKGHISLTVPQSGQDFFLLVTPE